MYSLYYAYQYNHSLVVGCRIDKTKEAALSAIKDVEGIPRVPFFSAGKEVSKEPSQEIIEHDLNIIRKHLMGDSF